MKQIKLFVALFILLSGFINAQKIGVVDTNYILSKLPQYKDAESRLNEQINGWQTEIQNLQTELDKKKALLENERVLLIGDQLKQRQKEVDDLDKKIKGMVNNRFGSMGELYNARANLSMGNISKFLIPIPPLAEQHRIVAKVDELMAICDQLKVKLQQSQETQVQLTDALIDRALG